MFDCRLVYSYIQANNTTFELLNSNSQICYVVRLIDGDNTFGCGVLSKNLENDINTNVNKLVVLAKII